MLIPTLMHQQVSTLLEREDIIFPPSIQNALELRQLLIDANSDMTSITNCITKDPIISLAVLKLASSPMYARDVRSVKAAVTVLGYSALNFLVFGLLQRQLTRLVPSGGKPIVNSLWWYSLDVASSAYAIAAESSGREVADEALLLSMVLHLDLMFVVYAASIVQEQLPPQAQQTWAEADYSIFIRRLAHQHRTKLLSLYGVPVSTAQELSLAYWAYPAESLPAPLTAVEALSLGINSTEIPYALRLLVPAATYVNELTQVQLEYKASVAQSLNFQ